MISILHVADNVHHQSAVWTRVGCCQIEEMHHLLSQCKVYVLVIIGYGVQLLVIAEIATTYKNYKLSDAPVYAILFFRMV